MTRISAIASALVASIILTGTAAVAEDWRDDRAHFIISVDEKLTSEDRPLRATLEILKVACFGHDGAYHYVLSAKSEGHVAAYLAAKGLQASGVRALPVKWTSDELSSFDNVQRMTLAAPVEVF